MTKKLSSVRKVKGNSVGEFTATEDGGMARDYGTLTEVVYQNGKHLDASYYVNDDNAQSFINEISNPS